MVCDGLLFSPPPLRSSSERPLLDIRSGGCGKEVMGTTPELDALLERARQAAAERHPDASPQKHAALANSVLTMCTGWSGGFGGSSVREHAAVRQFAGKGPLADGLFSEEEALRLLLDPGGPIFGPLTDVHREAWRCESCFDDDPRDVVELNLP